MNSNKRNIIGGYFIGGVITFFICFFIAISDFSLPIAFGGSLAFVLILISGLKYFDRRGKKKHKSIHQTKLFKELMNKGFQTEEIDEYIGLIKVQNGRSIRVYYDWNKRAQGFFSSGDIVIKIFYYPLSVDYENFDYSSLSSHQLNKNYEKLKGFLLARWFQIDRLTVCLNYYSWTTSETVLKQINEYIKLVEKEGLAPLDINNLDEQLIEQSKKGVFTPEILEFLKD